MNIVAIEIYPTKGRLSGWQLKYSGTKQGGKWWAVPISEIIIVNPVNND